MPEYVNKEYWRGYEPQEPFDMPIDRARAELILRLKKEYGLIRLKVVGLGSHADLMRFVERYVFGDLEYITKEELDNAWFKIKLDISYLLKNKVNALRSIKAMSDLNVRSHFKRKQFILPNVSEMKEGFKF